MVNQLAKGWARTGLALVLLGAAAGGCAREDWKPEVLADTSRSAEHVSLTRGREAYKTYCVGCHGVDGDGNGPAARFLDPPPRDLRTGIIKYAAVEAGQLPHDSDLVRAIRNGLHGTAMSAWQFLPDRTVSATIAYIKTFAGDAYADDEPHVEIVASLDPWSDGDKTEAIAEGKSIYHVLARCNNCHPSYVTRQQLYDLSKKHSGVGISSFRDNMYDAVSTDTEWGYKVLPPDFLTSTLRTGTDPNSLYRVIVSGVGGTAMPTWLGALSEEQLWAMVHYVDSLISLKGTPEATRTHEQLTNQPEFRVPVEDTDGDTEASEGDRQ